MLSEDLEKRTEFERQQFELYERRRIDYESQATTTTAGALTLAALLVAGSDRIANLGDVPRIGASVTLISLSLTIVLASIARYASFGTANRLAGVSRRDNIVGSTLERMRNVPLEANLQVLSYQHWRARAESAYELGRFKSLCVLA